MFSIINRYSQNYLKHSFEKCEVIFQPKKLEVIFQYFIFQLLTLIDSPTDLKSDLRKLPKYNFLKKKSFFAALIGKFQHTWKLAVVRQHMFSNINNSFQWDLECLSSSKCQQSKSSQIIINKWVNGLNPSEPNNTELGTA